MRWLMMCNIREHVDSNNLGNIPSSTRLDSGKLKYLDSDKRHTTHVEEVDGAIPMLREETGIKRNSSLIALISSDAFATSYTVLCACHSPDCRKND